MRTTCSSWAILRGRVKVDNIDLVNSPNSPLKNVQKGLNIL
jgi:hypothetical protein